MQVDVREATPEDAPVIAAVAEAAWWAGPSAALSADAVQTALADLYDEAFLAEVAEEAAGEASFRFLVAERAGDGDDEGVLGFASAAREWADEIELFTLYVDPDHWGEGIGTALLDALERWAVEQGVDRLVCAVLAENTVGCEFFGARGFERVRTVDGEVGGATVREAEFEKPLD